MTRRTFAGVLLAAGSHVVARAQNVAAEQRGKELVDSCVSALGGANFLQMQDRLEIGRAYSFYRERLSGLSVAHLYTHYVQPPAPPPVSYYGVQERQAFGKKQDTAVLFLPPEGFEVTFRGIRPLPDDSVARHREATVTNFLYILRQRLGEPGMTFEAGGIEVMDNRRVQTVDVYDNASRKITVYLSLETHLPVMQRYLRLDAVYKERVEEIMRFSKFRDAGSGVMWPLDFQRERDGEKIYQMFADSVTIGNHFAPDTFELPHGMQMLKKENF